jgi:hypothetical protein
MPLSTGAQRQNKALSHMLKDKEYIDFFAFSSSLISFLYIFMLGGEKKVSIH